MNKSGKRYFRNFLAHKLRFNVVLGVLLILLFGIPRFLLVLQASSGGNYTYVSMIFVAMCLTPFLLLNKQGREKIGMVAPARPIWWLYAVLIGLGACLAVYVTGKSLFGMGTDNWFVYISRSYAASLPVDFDSHRATAFLAMSAAAVTFSPLGEELLYRGLIHECFVPTLGEGRASMVDSAAFAITHLSHFGILFVAGHWEFHFLPALLWVMLMYFASRLFFYCKYKGGSLITAFMCHAGFNLGMTYIICYHIL